ncbi:MAG: 16S rRNA (cytosine(1402)-N(4))-methyltransferase RsmH [Desulfobacteraceae bacterium]
MPYHHVPAMLAEVVELLEPAPGDFFVDGTLGGAGHARAILEKITPGGILIGVDQDPEAVASARAALQPFDGSYHLFHDNFANLPAILAKLPLAAVDGILLDLGIACHHLTASGRGFSFQRDEPLDMRMNPETGGSAAELVNSADEKTLVRLFREYGEERYAPAVARRIAAERRSAPIVSSGQLARIVTAAIPRKSAASRRIHPATRVFMALRIAVNRELERLETFLKAAPGLLKPGGRLGILAFHSLEDRIVKHHFRQLARPCVCPPDLPRCVCGRTPAVRIVTPRARRPTAAEIARNPMARSTRLRVMEKL